MPNGSIFWFVVLAASGGVFVLVGLLMERFSEKDLFKNLSDFRRCKSRKVWGEWLVIVGIVVEIVVAIFSAIDAWETSPLNRPITTVSAVALIQFKGDGYMHQQVKMGETRAGISFFWGTNSDEKQQAFNLEAKESDVEFGNIIGGKTDQSYALTLHQNIPHSGFPGDNGLGKSAKSFNDVGCFVLSMPQISSNAEVVFGSVIVTVNSSLTWKFDIPPQKQRWGYITAKKIMISKNHYKMEVLPLVIVDNPVTPTWTNYFDGK